MNTANYSISIDNPRKRKSKLFQILKDSKTIQHLPTGVLDLNYSLQHPLTSNSSPTPLLYSFSFSNKRASHISCSLNISLFYRKPTCIKKYGNENFVLQDYLLEEIIIKLESESNLEIDISYRTPQAIIPVHSSDSSLFFFLSYCNQPNSFLKLN